ncbi:small conductance calcium-activated potassium channel protein 2 [Cricetulus griseus]|uniref:Small conductance calcium-activated potassium channel protein 2 n=1 Tax=Cricetulus griseus TaxID=10029 RepID=A0A061I5R0_CRIGR|nr:small conductance calcium-activated potassium channel protein 2 [Cricetulus griseus]
MLMEDHTKLIPPLHLPVQPGKAGPGGVGEGGLTNSTITQAQLQGFELAHPNIYPAFELLELAKGQSCRSNCNFGSKIEF